MTIDKCLERVMKLLLETKTESGYLLDQRAVSAIVVLAHGDGFVNGIAHALERLEPPAAATAAA